jgi:hypothetical protein
MISPNTENYLYGKGEVFFRKNGETSYLHLGNCPSFTLNVELEKAEHYSSMSGAKEKDLSAVIQKTATSTITLEELSVENMNLAFMGGDVEVATQESATMTGEEVIVVPDRFVPIGDVMRVSNVVVTDAASSPTVTYVEGEDYIVSYEAGMIMALSSGSISGTCYVSCDVASVKRSKVNALQNSSVVGELLFVGNPDLGPHWRVTGWKASLTINGELPLISDDISQLPVSLELLSDRSNHPDAPFFLAELVESGE